MALYSYEALNAEGKRVSGTVDASSVAAVREHLAKQGFYPTTIGLAKSQAATSQFFLARFLQRGVSAKEKILFTKQLTILLKSGVPLLQAIELLTEQFKGRFNAILVQIKDALREGTSLADAMGAYPDVFTTIYVQLVRAGEAGGRLENILTRLTEYLERREAIRKKISGAMQYPIIQLVIAILVVGVLVTTVIPQMQGLFEAQGSGLPASTQFLLSASDFFKQYYIVMGLVLGLSFVAFRYWKQTPYGARMWDNIKLKIPVIKYITKTNAVVQFSYSFGMLLEGGVNLAESLDIVVKVIDNRILADALRRARDKIIKQGKISEYLQQTNIFPPIAIYLLKTGEESGELDNMLLTVAKNYETELDELIDKATGLISPIMLIVMAVIVGFIIMAIMGPVMGAGQAFGVG